MLNILLLGLTSLLADFSSEMVVPILPFFIQAVGGGGLAVGLIFGIGDAVAALLKVFSGHIADRTKRYKLLVFGGYLFSAAAKFFFPFAQGWQQIGAIRAVERMGKGFRDAPRDAIVSESLELKHRGEGFGIQRAMDSLGAILGSVLVLVLFVYLGLSFRAIFLVSAVVALLAVAPILFVRSPENLKVALHPVSFRNLSPKLRRFLLVAGLFALANFSVAFFVLRAQASFGGLDFQEALEFTLFVYIFFNLFDAGFSWPAGMLSDHVGRRRVIMISYLLFSFVCLGFLLLSLFPAANLPSFLVLLVLFAFYGLFKAATDASQKAFVSDLSVPEVRGTALGTFDTITGLMAIPSGIIAGYLWNFDSRYTFLFGFALSLVAAGLLWRLTKEQK